VPAPIRHGAIALRVNRALSGIIESSASPRPARVGGASKGVVRMRNLSGQDGAPEGGRAFEGGKVVAFRRRERPGPIEHELAPSPRVAAARRDQRSLMDTVYEAGSLPVAAGDRETKLLASRLLVYGFLTIDEVGEDGATRRLRPSEAVRAGRERPWRLSRASRGVSLSVAIPAVDGFLFEMA
jgi:hypothetical protein